jgi:DNA-binding transcriptional LysR family regulator
MNQMEDMRIFVAAVNHGGFTAAARALGLSKQFISRRVSLLEARLGLRLLVRTTRRIAVTDLGREYFERATRILGEADALEESLSSRSAQLHGALRLTAPMSFGTMYLAPVVADFLKRYPRLTIELDLGDRYVDLLAEGYDMGIRLGVLGDSSLIARHVAPLRMVACCSPAYRDSRPPALGPDDLRHHDCVLYGHGRHVEWSFLRGRKIQSQAMHGRLRVNNGEFARDAAIAGLGISLLPEFIVRDALRAGTLVTVLGQCKLPTGAIHAVYPQHRQSSRAVALFVDCLVATLRGPVGEP